MFRLTQTASTYLSATLLVVAGCQLSAFEQGTYFIFQLVDQAEDTKVIDQRLALDSKLFVEAKKAQTTSAPATEKSSEFEMDYSSLGTTNSSGFESTFSTTSETTGTSDTSSFNLSTEKNTTSLFGN
jgi:hypothetical protein